MAITALGGHRHLRHLMMLRPTRTSIAADPFMALATLTNSAAHTHRMQVEIRLLCVGAPFRRRRTRRVPTRQQCTRVRCRATHLSDLTLGRPTCRSTRRPPPPPALKPPTKPGLRTDRCALRRRKPHGACMCMCTARERKGVLAAVLCPAFFHHLSSARVRLRRRALEGHLRVDHAGEWGAVRIYEGQVRPIPRRVAFLPAAPIP